MFSKFKELFGSENLLDQAFETTITMVEYDEKMFHAARTVLRESDSSELPFDVKKMDKKINKYEREVRRNVLTHLTIAGTHNLVPGLALVSVVIDVERIGDYTKNIVELARTHENKLKGGIHEDDLVKMEKQISDHIPYIIEILKNQDQKLAKKIMRAEEAFAERGDNIVADMIKEKDKKLPAGSSVAVAMYARYLKRINAHLTNIASSTVNPFHRIGFREKPKK